MEVHSRQGHTWTQPLRSDKPHASRDKEATWQAEFHVGKRWGVGKVGWGQLQVWNDLLHIDTGWGEKGELALKDRRKHPLWDRMSWQCQQEA